MSVAALAFACSGCDGQLSGTLDPIWSAPYRVPLTCDAETAPPPEASRNVQRLTRLQYAYAIADLFNVESPNVLTGAVSSRFESVDFDAAVHGYNTNHDTLTVSASLQRDYRRVAEGVATDLLDDPSLLNAVAPCQGATAPRTCAGNFLDDIGALAFRRPLTTSERESYLQLFDAASELIDAPVDEYTKGIALMTEGLLQSPYFLYRLEIGEHNVSLDGVAAKALTGYEIAARLAFALWNSVPDRELMESARTGALTTEKEIRAQAERMLQSPKFMRVVSDFFQQWLPAAEYGREARNPPLPETAGDSMREELVRFAMHNIESTRGDFSSLLSAPYTFVNQDLAEIYGLPGSFGPTFTQVELDPSQRAGILTQLGFLDRFASVNTSAPITRGVFVLERVLCRPVPAPDFQIMPPESTPETTTTRELFTVHTAEDTCMACHNTINGVGFLFENYGARGAYRETENGHPVDAKSEVRVNGELRAFDNAVEFITFLADEKGEAQACYFENWLTYIQGRSFTERDRCAVESIVDRIGQDGAATLREFLVEYAVSRAFRHHVDLGDVTEVAAGPVLPPRGAP